MLSIALAKTCVCVCVSRNDPQAVIPEDPDPRGVPSTVTFSPNAGHVAVCFSSGSLVVYELPYPERHNDRPMSPADTAAAAAILAAQPPGELTLVLHMPVATIRREFAGWVGIFIYLHILKSVFFYLIRLI